MNNDILYAKSLGRGMRFKIRGDTSEDIYSVYDRTVEFESHVYDDGNHTQFLVFNETTEDQQEIVLLDSEIVTFLGYNESGIIRDLKR